MRSIMQAKRRFLEFNETPISRCTGLSVDLLVGRQGFLASQTMSLGLLPDYVVGATARLCRWGYCQTMLLGLPNVYLRGLT